MWCKEFVCETTSGASDESGEKYDWDTSYENTDHE